MRRSLLSYSGTVSMWAWNKFTVFLDSHWRGLEWSHVQWHPVSRWSEVGDVVICLLHCSDFVWKLYPSFILFLFSIQVYPIWYMANTVLNVLIFWCTNVKSLKIWRCGCDSFEQFQSCFTCAFWGVILEKNHLMFFRVSLKSTWNHNLVVNFLNTHSCSYCAWGITTTS